MKAELKIPPEFIDEIVEKLCIRLKPFLLGSGKKEEDVIFDVEGLAQYLKVEPSWVYNQISQFEYMFTSCPFTENIISLHILLTFVICVPA